MAGKRLSQEEKDKILNYAKANMHLSIEKIADATGFSKGTVDYLVHRVIDPQDRAEARAAMKHESKMQDLNKMKKDELIELVETQKQIINNLRSTAMSLRGITRYESC